MKSNSLPEPNFPEFSVAGIPVRGLIAYWQDFSGVSWLVGTEYNGLIAHIREATPREASTRALEWLHAQGARLTKRQRGRVVRYLMKSTQAQFAYATSELDYYLG